jgi:hypothetical protein
MKRRTKVLVVDDDPIVLEVTRNRLVKAGYEVVTREDARRHVDGARPGGAGRRARCGRFLHDHGLRRGPIDLPAMWTCLNLEQFQAGLPEICYNRQ